MHNPRAVSLLTFPQAQECLTLAQSASNQHPRRFTRVYPLVQEFMNERSLVLPLIIALARSKKKSYPRQCRVLIYGPVRITFRTCLSLWQAARRGRFRDCTRAIIRAIFPCAFLRSVSSSLCGVLRDARINFKSKRVALLIALVWSTRRALVNHRRS